MGISMGVWRALKSAYGNITSSRDLYSLIIGGDLESGDPVTSESAMRASAVYSCVTVIEQTIAQTPCILYRRLKRGKERAVDHPLYRLIHASPNPFQTSYDWIEMAVHHMALRGNTYSFRSAAGGKLRELIPLFPDYVTPQIDDKFRVTYKYEVPGKPPRTYGPEQILHLRLCSPDGIVGVTPIQYQKHTISGALALERHGRNLFGKSARPSGLLTIEQKLSPEQVKQKRAEWQAAHTNENVGGTAVLDGGWKWTPLSLTSVDAQYIDTRKLTRSEIAGIWRVPSSFINDQEKSTFSNNEQQAIQFVGNMMPWFVRIERALTAQLLSEAEQQEYFFEFLVEALMRGDAKARAEFYHFAITDGWMKRNEARERENLNPEEGLDEFLYPANMMTVNGDTKTDEQTGGPRDGS